MYKSISIKPQKLFFLCLVAVLLGLIASVVAKVLLLTISLVTNFAYFHRFSFEEVELIHLAPNYLNILIPVIGGVVVGIMAKYGSSGIRGHGIPEVMETILTKESRIPRRITFLKPLSAAIAIGTGGPFGAEGPIIATGGSIGSWLGRHFLFSTQERKILLATGAAAGMTAIFGTPLAGILICIELLLFEFSIKSFIPVGIAVATAQIIRLSLGHGAPVFPIADLGQMNAANSVIYFIAGTFVGIIACFVSKLIFHLEDLFEKLPLHWMWWPALGGIAIGVIGIIEPRSLGVGYSNITSALQNSITLQMALGIFVWKLASWSIALSSGTSGGTLAPLLTLGSSLGLVLGVLGQHFFPEAGISIPMMALVGMASMFSGATRAILTSTLFAMETTGAFHGVAPLLLANCGAYIVSLVLMKETIMTEKISKRGIKVPSEYFSVEER